MAAKPKKPFVVGDRVKFTRRNGTDAKGIITQFIDRANGAWALVDTKEHGEIKVRESQLRR